MNGGLIMKRLLGIIIATMMLTVTVFGAATFADNSNTKTVTIKDGTNNINAKGYYMSYVYKATKSGRLTMTFSEDPGPITLTDTNGNSISDKTYGTGTGDSRTFVWAVRKGTTYKCYIWYHTNGVRKYTLKLSTKKISDKNIKKKKATKIKIGKSKAGMVANGQKKASWFKVKFKKARKGKFILKGKEIKGSLQVTFYKGKKKLCTTKIAGNSTVKLYSQAFTKKFNAKMSKGTYYIKFERWTTISGGDFTIKVK